MSPRSRLVSTVTARMPSPSSASPAASTAAAIIASLPCTVQKVAPRPDRLRTAPATVAGMSKNLRSAKTFFSRAVSQSSRAK